MARVQTDSVGASAGHTFLKDRAKRFVLFAVNIRALDGSPSNAAGYPAAMTRLLRHEERGGPCAVGLRAIVVQNLASPSRMNTGRPILVMPDGVVDQCRWPTQHRAALTGCRNERRNIQEVSDPFEARDDRSTVRMAKDNWRHQTSIDYLLYDCSVRT